MREKSVPGLLVAGDVIAMLVAFFGGYAVGELLSHILRDGVFTQFSSGYTYSWLWLYLSQLVGAVLLFAARGHYTQKSPWWEQVKYVVLVCIWMMVLTGCVLYALQLPYSRLWMVSCFVLSVPFIVVSRLVVRKIAICMGMWRANLTIIGGPENVLETIFAVNSDNYNFYDIKEIYLVGTDSKIPEDQLPSRLQGCVQLFITRDELPDLIRSKDDRYFIVAPDEDSKIDMRIISEMIVTEKKDIAIVPPMRGMSLYGMDVQHFFGSHTVLLKPKKRVGKPVNRALKRTLDVVGAVTGLVVLAIPILVISLYIRKDGGNAFYYQKRIGRNGTPFKCWKLRSMVPNSKEMLEEILATDEEARKEWESDFKLKNDPRITSIGHVIRKTSVDELPQLWNVIRGDMSLVGPRPIVEKELEYYGKHKDDYLGAKPGLTGLWQVSGRNDTSYAYRVYLDSWYVAHWSVWTDIVIIIQTVGILMNRKGAY